MREMMSHRPGRIYLCFLLLTIVAVIVVIALGVLETNILLFGFVTMPLLVGVVFVLLWLVAYAIYFFKYWDYR